MLGNLMALTEGDEWREGVALLNRLSLTSPTVAFPFNHVTG